MLGSEGAVCFFFFREKTFSTITGTLVVPFVLSFHPFCVLLRTSRIRAKDPRVVQIEWRNFLRWYYSHLEVSRLSDDVAEIEHTRGIINSLDHYPKYLHFCYIFNAAPRLFPSIFFNVQRKICFCENTFDFLNEIRVDYFLTRVTICRLVFINIFFFNLFDNVTFFG